MEEFAEYLPIIIAFGLFFLIAYLLIFLIIREILCWYWKINKQVSELKKIREILERMEKNGNLNPADKIRGKE
jgi:cadmium resistance protein CadD (predicted permease)